MSSRILDSWHVKIFVAFQGELNFPMNRLFFYIIEDTFCKRIEVNTSRPEVDHRPILQVVASSLTPGRTG